MRFLKVFLLAVFLTETAAVAEMTSTENSESTVLSKSTVVSEEKIPLNLSANTASKTTDSSILKIIMTISVLGLLTGISFLYLRKTGYKNSKLKPNQIKILTQYHLGPKKSLAVVHIAGESMLIGLTDQNISLIKTLSLLDEEIPHTTPMHFAQTLVDKTAQEGEEFSMTGIQDLVSDKIKNMRPLA